MLYGKRQCKLMLLAHLSQPTWADESGKNRVGAEAHVI